MLVSCGKKGRARSGLGTAVASPLIEKFNIVEIFKLILTEFFFIFVTCLRWRNLAVC
jgi:hypothetical protein